MVDVPHAEDAPGSGVPIAELTKLYYAGAWTEAERLCEAILSQQPQHAEVLLIWAEAALARGDARAARERLRRTIRAPLPNCDAVLRALRLLDRAGDHEALESATRYWGAQLRREPAHYALLYALGLASGFLGRIDEAVRAFEAACALVPSNGGPDTYRSILLLRRNDNPRSPAAALRWRCSVGWAVSATNSSSTGSCDFTDTFTACGSRCP